VFWAAGHWNAGLVWRDLPVGKLICPLLRIYGMVVGNLMGGAIIWKRSVGTVNASTVWWLWWWPWGWNHLYYAVDLIHHQSVSMCHVGWWHHC